MSTGPLNLMAVEGALCEGCVQPAAFSCLHHRCGFIRFFLQQHFASDCHSSLERHCRFIHLLCSSMFNRSFVLLLCRNKYFRVKYNNGSGRFKQQYKGSTGADTFYTADFRIMMVR